MDQVQYPTHEDIIRFNDLIPSWQLSASSFLKDDPNSESGDIFHTIEINSWVRLIAQRMQDADYAFIMSSFYLERGIPDEEWYRSTETGIEYFHNFNDEHNRNKFAFEYHSDVYFYKIFSALDAIAHLITIVLQLSLGRKEKLYFSTTVRKIKAIKPNLYSDLHDFLEKEEYKRINSLRNDSTHNFSKGHVDSGVKRTENETSLTVGNYMPVKEKYKLMKWFNQQRCLILDKISKQLV